MTEQRPKRILILDDDAMVRRAMLRIASARSDVILEAVGTPDEVLARLAADDGFDLVVCDYRLVVDGKPRTSEALVRELAGRGVPVAVMTGDRDTVPHLLGITTIEKPFVMDDLLADIARRERG